jgi:phosphoribosyl-ATP pyrophosphohydrolase/phosphoribosyl-AMP cyclohydrolase
VVVQHAQTGAVLTLAYANRAALERTLAERATWLFSRSRGALWKKGETSGNTQRVVSVAFDCDADALLYRVIPAGPACHTGAPSCFSGELLAAGEGAPGGEARFEAAIAHLREVVASRRGADPATSYTAKLLAGGVDRIGKKIGEEATEVVIAAKNGARAEIAWEVGDLLYHTIVLLEACGVPLDAIGEELLRRAK